VRRVTHDVHSVDFVVLDVTRRQTDQHSFEESAHPVQTNEDQARRSNRSALADKPRPMRDDLRMKLSSSVMMVQLPVRNRTSKREMRR
jgi:hypothetical protein